MRKHLLLFGLLLTIYAQAETLVSVHRMQQKDIVQVASVLGKMTMHDGNLQVISIDGDTIAVLPLEDEIVIRIGVKSMIVDSLDIPVVEDDSTSTAIANMGNTEVCIYPNPTTDILYLTGLNVGDVLRLYTMTGTEVETIKIMESAISLPVTSLPVGQYILIVGNQFFNLIKQ